MYSLEVKVISPKTQYVRLVFMPLWLKLVEIKRGKIYSFKKRSLHSSFIIFQKSGMSILSLNRFVAVLDKTNKMIVNVANVAHLTVHEIQNNIGNLIGERHELLLPLY